MQKPLLPISTRRATTTSVLSNTVVLRQSAERYWAARHLACPVHTFILPLVQNETPQTLHLHGSRRTFRSHREGRGTGCGSVHRDVFQQVPIISQTKDLAVC